MGATVPLAVGRQASDLVYGLQFRAWGSGFGVGLGFRVWGLGGFGGKGFGGLGVLWV